MKDQISQAIDFSVTLQLVISLTFLSIINFLFYYYYYCFCCIVVVHYFGILNIILLYSYTLQLLLLLLLILFHYLPKQCAYNNNISKKVEKLRCLVGGALGGSLKPQNCLLSCFLTIVTRLFSQLQQIKRKMKISKNE